MPATTLEEAFNNLNPREAIQPAQVATLFVKRPHSPVEEMAMQLRVSKKPLKLLFVGHRGSGKSSELAYLSTLLEKRFTSLFVPLYEIFQSPAVSHTELIFAITLRLLQAAGDAEAVPQGVVNDIWEKLNLEDHYKALRQFLFGAQIPKPAQARSVQVKLSVLAAELETNSGTTGTRRWSATNRPSPSSARSATGWAKPTRSWPWRPLRPQQTQPWPPSPIANRHMKPQLVRSATSAPPAGAR